VVATTPRAGLLDAQGFPVLYGADGNPTTSIFREKALAELDRAKAHAYQGWLGFLSDVMGEVAPNPDELVQEHGLDVYEEMVQREEALSFGLELKAAALLSTGHEIRPGGEDELDRRILDFTVYTLDQMRGSVERMLYHMMIDLDEKGARRVLRLARERGAIRLDRGRTQGAQYRLAFQDTAYWSSGSMISGPPQS